MEKTAISFLVPLLAGFITAVATFVKLVNDKESKVTQFRQQWTDSARQAMATLLSQIRTYCELAIDLVAIGNQNSRSAKAWLELKPNTDDAQTASDSPEAKMVEMEYQAQTNAREGIFDALREHRAAIHNSYALAKLHFKPDDPDFPHFQSKIDQALALLEAWKRSEERNAEALRSSVSVLVTEAEAIGRTLLKKEWETIKGGEPSYKKTKVWAKVGGIVGAVLLLVLFAVSGVMALLEHKEQEVRKELGKSTESGDQVKLSDASSQRSDNSCPSSTPAQFTLVQQNSDGGERKEYVRESIPVVQRNYKPLRCTPVK